MGQRKRIGIVYSYNENWIGGTYYVQNLIHALALLEDRQKPFLLVLTSNTEVFAKLKEDTQYPYMDWYPIRSSLAKYNVLERVVNKIWRTLFSTNLIKKRVSNHMMDALFPCSNVVMHGLENVSIQKKIFWIPDFQALYLPHLYSEKEHAQILANWGKIEKAAHHIVFSSKDAQADFQRTFPKSNAKLTVMHFAVNHIIDQNTSTSHLLKKYNLPLEYFFCANQFWEHKNHLLVLKAICQMVANGKTDIHIAFSGKPYDHRNPDHFKTLTDYIAQNNLSKYVSMLGFLPRNEQLALMGQAKAVIQPSLFEGWSTVVEDAKALGQKVLLSNLKVHQEQMEGYTGCVLFFDPFNEHSLIKAMGQYQSLVSFPKEDYCMKQLAFGHSFLNVLEQVER